MIFSNDEELKRSLSSQSSGKILDQTIVSVSNTIEMRYDDNSNSLPFFNDFSVLEDTIDKLQSPSVLGSNADQPIASKGGSEEKHCWVEVHEMLKSPLKFLPNDKSRNKTTSALSIWHE